MVKSDKKHFFNFRVSSDLLDSYGHMNNAHYLELYENARWDILEQSGMGRQFLSDAKIGPVILEITIRFSHELTEGQYITIETNSRKKGDRLFYFDQKMINEEGKVCNLATFTTSLFDIKNRKMIRADGKWLTAMGF